MSVGFAATLSFVGVSENSMECLLGTSEKHQSMRHTLSEVQGWEAGSMRVGSPDCRE